MKLPNFTVRFNKLKEKMGAKTVNWSPDIWNGLTAEEIVGRLKGGGLDVHFSDIEVCDDSTFEFKGHKVLVYIRDQYYGYENYKFHICTCKTIKDMQDKGRLQRFVVSTKTDGKFLVNLIDQTTKHIIEKNQEKELNVCKNCLMELQYKGYSSHFDKKSSSIYSNFNLEEFFRLYPSSKHKIRPEYSDINAPVDTYTDDWKELSRKIREKRNWTCEKCGINLKHDQEKLHVHHKNGIKSDNSPENLIVLCETCHSKIHINHKY